MIDTNPGIAFKNETQTVPQEGEQHPGLGHVFEEATHSWANIFTTHFSCAKVRQHYGKVITDTADDKVNSIKKIAPKLGGCCCGESRKTETDPPVDYQIIPNNQN